jgi:3-hydroxybutyryl-CoA dehydrogenase
MEIKQIGVIGVGVMGSQMAGVCAQHGYAVSLGGRSSASLEQAEAGIRAGLEKAVAKGRITDSDCQAALARLSFTDSLEDACAGADLVLEAVVENLAVKHEVFKTLDAVCKPGAILATNTSALPITEIASVTQRGGQIIGLHFMTPVAVMKGVEVIRGQNTTDDTFNTCIGFLEQLGKAPVIAVDYAGFIVSRLVDVLMNEAVKMIQEGNDPAEIDKAMKLCAGHPMGPCELLDLVGADIVVHGLTTMARDLGDRYLPHPLLKKRVLAGQLGRKSGRGFYNDH